MNPDDVRSLNSVSSHDKQSAQYLDSFSMSDLTVSSHRQPSRTTESETPIKSALLSGAELTTQGAAAVSVQMQSSEITIQKSRLQELKRLSDSNGYCAFLNIPEKRERRKVLDLCSRLEKNQFRIRSIEGIHLQGPLQQSRSPSRVLSCHGRIRKYKDKRNSALRRQSKKQKSLLMTFHSTKIRRPTINKRTTASIQFQSTVSSLDPVVAASFDKDGTPTVDHVGRSSLHIAMGSFHKPTLQHAVNVFKTRNMLSCRDNADFTPLHIACSVGNYDAAELLLQAGASPNECGGDSGSTPLYEAVIRSNLSLVKLLVDFGADLIAKDKNGRTISEIKTSYEVQSYIRSTLDSHQCNSPGSEPETHEPVVCQRKLPSIFVLQSPDSPNLRPYVLLSELCESINLPEKHFRRLYQNTINILRLENGTLASRIINPFLRDSFERSVTASVSGYSDVLEVDFIVKCLFDSIRNESTGNTIERSYKSDSDEAEATCLEEQSEAESQVLINAGTQVKRIVKHRKEPKDLIESNHTGLTANSPHSQSVLRESELDSLCEDVEKTATEGLIHCDFSVHQIDAQQHTSDQVPEFYLDLDTPEDRRLTPGTIKCSRRKAHPMLSAKQSNAIARASNQAETSDRTNVPPIGTETDCRPSRLTPMDTSYWESFPTTAVEFLPDLETCSPESNDVTPVINEPPKDLISFISPLTESLSNSAPAESASATSIKAKADSTGMHASEEIAPPDVGSATASSTESDTESGSESGRPCRISAAKPCESLKSHWRFNLSTHPGDIYAATRVKPLAPAFSMLAACKSRMTKK